MNYPTISVIIPRKADDSAEEAIQAILHADYPQQLLEIIEVTGQNPSKQRNLGAAIASGEILYFLDNDSIVPPTLFSQVVKYYLNSQDFLDDQPKEGKKIAGVGGPNLTPATDGFLQKIAGYAMASPFAALNMCARFKSTGKVRYAGEKELILCNLSIRRETFLQEKGFNESLYPNEENELINRLMKKGCQFIYDPGAYIYRSRRHHVLGFIKQLFHYGGGRADQIMVEGPSLKSLLFFLPAGFVCYLMLLVLLIGLGALSWWMLLPFGLYSVFAAFFALLCAVQERTPVLAVILPIWYGLMHLAYGIGFLWRCLATWGSLRHHQEFPSQGVGIIIRKKLCAQTS